MNCGDEKNGKRRSGEAARRKLALEHEELLDPEEGQIGAGGVEEPARVIYISGSLARQLRETRGWTFPKTIRF